MKLIIPSTLLLAVLASNLHESSAFTINKNSNNNHVGLFHYASPIESISTVLFAAGSKITMPALSSTMKEGRVVSWLKSEGDAIEAGEAIMVVESDKADMDVEAFEDGFLAKIIIPEGGMAPVGEAVALVAESKNDIESVVASFTNGSSEAAPATSTPAPSKDSPNAATTTSTTTSSAHTANKPDFEFSQIDMPALSSTMKEGKVVSWLKSEGDSIAAGEAIMVVESDKADMDVEAFEDGYLAAILTNEGESGAVGAPVALIAQDEKDIPALQEYAKTLGSGASISAPEASTVPAQTPAASGAYKAPPIVTESKSSSSTKSTGTSSDRVVASPLARKKAEELGVDIASVTGSGPDGRITASDVEDFAKSGKSAAPKKSAAASTDSKPSWTPAPGVIAATPMARALAKKAKIDLSTIKGTGQFGRVTVDDVKIATGEKKPEPAKRIPTTAAASSVEMPEGVVPMTGMQRAVSNNMVATLSVPEFRVSREIVMDNFDALYQKLKPKGVTVSALLAKAVALAIEKHPIINSSFSDANGGSIKYNKDINIAMAVAIDGGLITPTLKYANERGVTELAENWSELVGKAKSGTLKPDEYNSGTFTISNMGMFGVTQFGAILPKGQGGILAIGATQEMIVPCNQAVLGMKKVKKMTVTLTCDHRQIYGADAALFLKTLADIMENQLSRLST